MTQQRSGARGRLLLLAVLFTTGVWQRTALALETKTITRGAEPVAKTAADLRIGNFYGASITNFAGWRYSASTETWTQVPLQIDHRYYRNYGQDVICNNGKPACACTNPKTCALCEMSYVNEGDSDPDDQPNSNALDANDEIAFMVKDTGDEAPEASSPSGASGLPRYAIRVSHPSSGLGWIYLYKYSSAAPTIAPYMELSLSGSGATQLSTFKACNHQLLDGVDVYETILKGNWSLVSLKTRTASGANACGISYTNLDVLDRVKWRMSGETDELWNSTSNLKGTRSGPVRVLRWSLGAASGYGTSHYFTAYPTMLREDVHLRVHDLNANILGYIDWNSAAADLNGQACPVLHFEAWRRGATVAPFSYVDGGCFPTVVAGFDEPHQLNGPYISLGEVFYQDPQHPIPSSSTSFYYNEDGGADLEVGLEDEAGAYGNIGVNLGQPNATEEKSCSEVKFAGITRIWAPQTSDTGQSRTVNLDRDLRERPLEATSMYQCYGCGGGGGPSTPCAPTLTAADPGNGFQTHMSLASPCGGDLWFRLYRAIGASGSFSALASLGTSTTFDDYRVERGQTYRYYATSYNALGTESAGSSTTSLTVTDVTAPSAPTISGGVSGNTVSLAWDWTSDFDLVGYHIYRATQSSGPYTKLTVGGPVRAIAYNFQVLQSGVTYYAVVKAIDAAGIESAASNEVTLAIP